MFTWMFHTNQPNVGGYTNPMDPMGIVFLFFFHSGVVWTSVFFFWGGGSDDILHPVLRVYECRRWLSSFWPFLYLRLCFDIEGLRSVVVSNTSVSQRGVSSWINLEFVGICCMCVLLFFFLVKFRTHLNSHLRTCNQLSFAWILWAVFNWQFSVWICCVPWFEIRNRWSHCHGHKNTVMYMYTYVYNVYINRYVYLHYIYIFVYIPFSFPPKKPQHSSFFFSQLRKNAKIAVASWYDMLLPVVSGELQGSKSSNYDLFRCQVIHPSKNAIPKGSMGWTVYLPAFEP